MYDHETLNLMKNINLGYKEFLSTKKSLNSWLKQLCFGKNSKKTQEYH